MFAANVGGIVWTIYNCFFIDRHDLEELPEEKIEETLNFNNLNKVNSKLTARITFK